MNDIYPDEERAASDLLHSQRGQNCLRQEHSEPPHPLDSYIFCSESNEVCIRLRGEQGGIGRGEEGYGVRRDGRYFIFKFKVLFSATMN